jgi:hypothetical protein
MYTVGDRVSQAQYGHGTITLANDHHTMIDFDEHGSRTFATRLVRLEQSTTVAPPKPAKTRRRSASRPKGA